MRWFICNSCGKGYHVHGALLEMNSLMPDWKSGYPCITPLCRGRLQGTAPQSHSIRFKEVPLLDFYRAVKGFGLCNAANLKKTTKLLTEKRIVAVEGESIGTPERTIIRCLVLEDGTRLHFDASSKGACLYYIEETRDDSDSEGAPEGSSEDREEAGRGTQDDSEVVIDGPG